ncbi:hypothetical protein Greip_gp18 [Pelagibacter phage Greip EXVC021P]|nr:hypothetical protein Greip_gp18 [Pelagibacter phage Greip EXVC021P]
MGSNGASGSADAPNTTRSTLSSKNQAKADKKSKAEANVEVGLGKTKTQRAVETVGNFVKTGGITGAVVRGVTSAVRRGRVNTDLMGTSDYQGSSTKSSTTNSMNDGRGDNQSNVGAATSSGIVVQAPTVTSPTTSEVSQVTSADARDAANLLIKKRRGRGRSSTILTSTQGIQDNKGLTLGKPTLLG